MMPSNFQNLLKFHAENPGITPPTFFAYAAQELVKEGVQKEIVAQYLIRTASEIMSYNGDHDRDFKKAVTVLESELMELKAIKKQFSD